MLLIWRYAALIVGCLGSVLAFLTAFGMALNWPKFVELSAASQILFGLTVIGGVVQWMLFWRRQFDIALWVFALTPLCWAAGVYVHIQDFCGEQPCHIVVRPAAWLT